MTTIRVSDKTRHTLRGLARELGEPMHVVAEKAIELYRRQRMIEQTNAAYAALRADPAIWQDQEAERVVLDGVLLDGLEDT